VRWSERVRSAISAPEPTSAILLLVGMVGALRSGE